MPVRVTDADGKEIKARTVSFNGGCALWIIVVLILAIDGFIHILTGVARAVFG